MLIKPQLLLYQQTNLFTAKSTLSPLHTTFAYNNLIDRKREICNAKKKTHSTAECCVRGESSKLNAVASPGVPAPLAANAPRKTIKITTTVIVQIKDDGLLDYIDNIMGRKILVQLVAAEDNYNSEYTTSVPTFFYTFIFGWSVQFFTFQNLPKIVNRTRYLPTFLLFRTTFTSLLSVFYISEINRLFFFFSTTLCIFYNLYDQTIHKQMGGRREYNFLVVFYLNAIRVNVLLMDG